MRKEYNRMPLLCLILGALFLYLGLTEAASNKPYTLPPIESPKPKTVISDKEAGYDQAKYDECLDRADLSDEVQCE